MFLTMPYISGKLIVFGIKCNFGIKLIYFRIIYMGIKVNNAKNFK